MPGMVGLRKTDERKHLNERIQTKYPYLPKEISSKAIDRMMYLLLEKA